MLHMAFGSLCSQTEMKIKVLEAKHQEEKLKMQQRHDAEVEKVRTKAFAKFAKTPSAPPTSEDISQSLLSVYFLNKSIIVTFQLFGYF